MGNGLLTVRLDRLLMGWLLTWSGSWLQVESSGRSWHALRQDFLWRQEQRQVAVVQQQVASMGAGGLAVTAPGVMAASVLEAMLMEQLTVASPFVPPPVPPAAAGGLGHGRPLRPWKPEDLRLAMGESSSADGTGGGGRPEDAGASSSSSSSSGVGGGVATHPLQVRSAYEAATGSEPAFTTCHDK